MAKRDLSVTGIWRLISVETETDDGAVTYPFGKDVGGLVMIDGKGYVSAQLMDMSRPAFKNADPRDGTLEEVKAAFENYIGYYGSFDLDETRGAMTFRVKGAWLPNWIGTDQTRYYTLTKNRMTISSPPLLCGGKRVVPKLIWERVN